MNKNYTFLFFIKKNYVLLHENRNFNKEEI